MVVFIGAILDAGLPSIIDHSVSEMKYPNSHYSAVPHNLLVLANEVIEQYHYKWPRSVALLLAERYARECLRHPD